MILRAETGSKLCVRNKALHGSPHFRKWIIDSKHQFSGFFRESKLFGVKWDLCWTNFFGRRGRLRSLKYVLETGVNMLEAFSSLQNCHPLVDIRFFAETSAMFAFQKWSMHQTRATNKCPQQRKKCRVNQWQSLLALFACLFVGWLVGWLVGLPFVCFVCFVCLFVCFLVI